MHCTLTIARALQCCVSDPVSQWSSSRLDGVCGYSVSTRGRISGSEEDEVDVFVVVEYRIDA
jgi:hypothetical protein